jgi:hypothetical protein
MIYLLVLLSGATAFNARAKSFGSLLASAIFAASRNRFDSSGLSHLGFGFGLRGMTLPKTRSGFFIPRLRQKARQPRKLLFRRRNGAWIILLSRRVKNFSGFLKVGLNLIFGARGLGHARL